MTPAGRGGWCDAKDAKMRAKVSIVSEWLLGGEEKMRGASLRLIIDMTGDAAGSGIICLPEHRIQRYAMAKFELTGRFKAQPPSVWAGAGGGAVLEPKTLHHRRGEAFLAVRHGLGLSLSWEFCNHLQIVN